MSKRLLALLLIVCFMLSIPCQASAASNVTQGEQSVSTSSEAAEEETVAVEEETLLSEKEEDEEGEKNDSSDKDSSIGGELLKEKIDELYEKDIFVISSDKPTNTPSTGSSSYACYPGGKFHYVSLDDDGSVYWTWLSIAYRAYKVDSQGNKVYGFTTCAHGLDNRVNNYVYSKENGTEEDIIGVVYENGFEIDTSKDKMDYSFIRLLPGKRMADTTAYEDRRIVGMGSVDKEDNIHVWKEGSTAPNVNDSTVNNPDTTANYPDSYPSWTMIDIASTTSGFSKRGDSGGLVYKAGTENTYQAVGIISGGTKDETLSKEKREGFFVRADRVSEKHNIYVHDGTETNPKSGTSGKCGANVTWNYDENNRTLTITGSGEMYNYYCTPWSDYYDSIERVVIGDGVTSIGEYAFYNLTTLESVIIGNSVKSIGYNAFAWCSALESVEIPASVTSIGYHIFYGCYNLNSIRFCGQEPSDINEYAFEGLVTSIYYPEGLNYSNNEYGAVINKRIAFTPKEEGIELLASLDFIYSRQQLNWNQVDGATEYKIFSKEDNGALKFVGTTIGTSFLDTTEYVNKTVSYYVVAVASNTIKSNTVSLQYGEAAPTVTCSNSKVNGAPILSWTSVNGAQMYEVYYSESVYGHYNILTNTQSTSYTLESHTNYKKYYYKVRAVLNNSMCSDSVYAVWKLLAPELHIENDSESKKIKLTWDNIKGATDYSIIYSSSNTSYSFLKQVKGTSYIYDEAERGKKYYFRVSAIDNDLGRIRSDSSNTVEIVCGYETPVLRVNNDPATNKPKLTWNAVNNATSYMVSYSMSENGEPEGQFTTTDTFFVHSGAVRGEHYYYKVRSITAGTPDVESADSKEVEAICGYETPQTTLVLVEDTGKPNLSWQDIDGADSYQLFIFTKGIDAYTEYKTLETNSYVHEDAKEGTKYYYKVRACYKDGKAYSAYSETKNILCRCAKPTIEFSAHIISGKPKIDLKNRFDGYEYLLYISSDKVDYNYYDFDKTGGVYLEAIDGQGYFYKIKTFIPGREDSTVVYSSDIYYKAQFDAPIISVSAQADTKLPVVSWNKLSGPKEYEVAYSTSKYGTYTTVPSITGNEYIHKDAKVGQTYYYKVRLTYGPGSDYSTIESFTYALPKIVVTTKNDVATGKPMLSWNTIKDADCYDVMYSTGSNSEFKKFTTVTACKYVHKAASLGQTYRYMVQARDKNGNLIASSSSVNVKQITCVLPAPKVTISNDEVSGKPKLFWPRVVNAQYYKVYRCSSVNGNYEEMETVNNGLSGYIDKTAEAQNPYYYKVRAFNPIRSDVTSEYSQYVAIKCKFARPTLTVRYDFATGKPRLSWEKIDGATKYQIAYATEYDHTYRPLTSVTVTSYVHYEAVDDVTHYYKVMVANGIGSAYSTAVELQCRFSSPQWKTGEYYYGHPNLQWQAVEGATVYEIERYSEYSGQYEPLATVAGGRTYYIDNDTEPGKTYSYQIRVGNGAKSAYSNVHEQICKLAYPSFYVTYANGKPCVMLDRVTGATEYKVYRLRDGEKNYSLLTDDLTNSYYVDKSAEAGATYYYKVQACYGSNSEANSEFSTELSKLCLYDTPSGFNVYHSFGQPKLYWSKVKGATEYTVYRSESQYGVYEPIKTTTSLIYKDTDTQIGKTYYYKLKAGNPDNPDAQSGFTNYKSIQCIYAYPDWSGVDYTCGHPNIKWDSVAGAKMYKVYRSYSYDGRYTEVEETPNTSFIDWNTEVGETYFYKVQVSEGYVTGVQSELSSYRQAICKYERPQINSITTTSSDWKPYLSWSAISGVTKYSVFRSTSANGTYSILDTIDGTTYTDESAQVGNTYYYKVKVCESDKGVDSELSDYKQFDFKYQAPTWGDTDYYYGHPKLHWNAVSGAASYEIYRCSTINGDYSRLNTVYNTTSYVDYGPSVGQSYYYKIRVGNGIGSDYSVASSFSCIYAYPKWIGVDNTNGYPKIEWEAVAGAKKYRVYRSYTYDGNYSIIKNETTDTYFIDENTEVGETYYYKVQVIEGNVPGVQSIVSDYRQVACQHERPQITSIITSTDWKPYLRWGAISGATKYSVFRATSADGTYSILDTIAGTTYTDESAKVGNTYYYKVKVCESDAGVDSELSDYKQFDFKYRTPTWGTPKRYYGRPNLQWNAVNGATKYEIYRCSSISGEYSKIDTVYNRTYYIDYGPSIGETYYYKIRVGDGIGSNRSTAYEYSRIYAYPNWDEIIYLGDGNPVIKWEKVDGAQEYDLYYSKKADGKNKVFINRVKGIAYTHTEAVPGDTYYYWVKVAPDNNGVDSDFSYCKKEKIRIPIQDCIVEGIVDCFYTGALQYADPIIVYNGKVLSEYVDYEVCNANNKGPGTGSVIITGIGNYCGERTYYYNIKLKTPTLTVSNGTDGKKVLSWNKIEGADAYRIIRKHNGTIVSSYYLKDTLTLTEVISGRGVHEYEVVACKEGISGAPVYYSDAAFTIITV